MTSEEMNVSEDMEDNTVIAELRSQIKTLKSENKTLKPVAQQQVFKDVGLDINSGFGKAVSKLYTGPLETEALQSFIDEEFGEVEVQAPVPEASEPVSQMNQGQQRVSQVMSKAGSAGPTDISDAFNEVVQNGTVKDTIAARLSMIDSVAKEQNK
tara:strand:- start:299 stop:763 length:465 start_codon:yes stop_codon:yes gene_type:complete